MNKTNKLGMPLVGYGLWKVPKEDCADLVFTAIEKGYRHFDSACDYGNEKEVGEGIKRAISNGFMHTGRTLDNVKTLEYISRQRTR